MNTEQKPTSTRMRIKTSCTECQKRRKKCNKGKPCSNCIRRYPAVECTYDKRIKRSAKPDLYSPYPISKTKVATEVPPSLDPQDHMNKLPGLSTLNLPGSTPLTPPTVLPKLDTGDWTKHPVGPSPSAHGIKTSKSMPMSRDPDLYSKIAISRSMGNETSSLLRDIAVEPTASNAELFHLYFKCMLPSLWSVDGAITPPPPVISQFWIPFMSSSTILVHANLLRAAIWRAGNRPTSSPISPYDLANPTRWMASKDTLEILTLKSKSISLLNARLRSGGSLSVNDEAIASVIFFFYNEWCWGVRESFTELNPHAKGLQEMIRIRGGVRNLHGQQDFLAKFVMLVNYHVAIILERELFICPPSLHDYRYIFDYTSLGAGIDSPLYKGSRPAGDTRQGWGVDKATSLILNDIHWMTSSLHAYMTNGRNCEEECKEWFLRANRVRSQISSLPQISTLNKETAIETVIYECCRLTATVYCKAILTYKPFSIACSLEDLNKITSAMILVPCTRWKDICGIWLWILCVFNPCARYRYEGLQMRMFLKNCTSALGLADWQILINTIEAFLSVQRFIRRYTNAVSKLGDT